MARQQNQQNQIATLEPVRMQMPAHVATEYGLTPDTWRAVIDAVFPLAKSPAAVLMALAWCKQRKYDIFQRVCHIVPMKVGTREVETVWPGISHYRIQAQRQADFFGWDEVIEGPVKEFAFKDRKAVFENGSRSGYENVEVKVSVPEFMQFVVYKRLHGERVRLVGPKCYFTEWFSPVSRYCNVPNERWARSPYQMLEKCAEAASLRRAWPDVFGDEPTAEEMDGKIFNSTDDMPEGEYVDVGEERQEVEPTDKPTPSRADYGAEARTEAAGAKTEGRRRQASDPAYGAQQSGKDGPQPEPQDDRAASGDGGDDAQQPEPSSRNPGPVPEGYASWDAWHDQIRVDIKAAPNLPPLKQVVEAYQQQFDEAPDKIQEAVREFHADHKQDLIEATR